ncbi:5000_t:CDS:2, partial [Diversispora eburnea]
FANTTEHDDDDGIPPGFDTGDSSKRYGGMLSLQPTYPPSASVGGGNYPMNNFSMYAQSPQQYMVQQTQQFYPQVTQVTQTMQSIAANMTNNIITLSQQSSPNLESSINCNDMVSPSLISPSLKKPKLRVQIPDTKDKQTTSAGQQQQQSSQDQSPVDDTPSDTPMSSSQPMQSSRPTPATAEAGPTSALPSQFAQNLPSPSTFFSEFYKTTELPSPLTFGNTPTSANPGPFHWPAPRNNYQHQPSPLAKHENNNSSTSATSEEESIDEPDKKKMDLMYDGNNVVFKME